jgi:hypothetical protein
VSSRRKGNELENRARRELEEAGWLVERCRPDLRWIGPGRCLSVSVDFFGAFDLWAVGTDGHRLIQICADSGNSPAVRRRKIEAVAPAFPPADSIELWRWRAGRARAGDRLARGWIRERFRAGQWEPLTPPQ